VETTVLPVETTVLPVQPQPSGSDRSEGGFRGPKKLRGGGRLRQRKLMPSAATTAGEAKGVPRFHL
jgi:hypothetical protein